MTTILAIPGDGIGKEVVPLALELMNSLDRHLTIITAPAGYEEWLATGKSLPDGVWNNIPRAQGILFGCAGTPSPPPMGYVSPILTLRHALGLSINIRHCKSFNGNGLDVYMFRNSTEGLYIGKEKKIHDGMVAEHWVTSGGTEKICRAAGELAIQQSKRVTIVHKANVLQTEAFFRQKAIETLHAMGADWNEALSDAAGYFLVKEPRRYQVMVMSSEVGDILSDVGAAVAGSLGLVPSLSIGRGIPLAEPIHGSAPDLKGTGRANPAATLLSLAWLYDTLGASDIAKRMRSAVERYLLSSPAWENATTQEIMEGVRAAIRIENGVNA